MLNRAGLDAGAVWQVGSTADDFVAQQRNTYTGNRAGRFGGGLFFAPVCPDCDRQFDDALVAQAGCDDLNTRLFLRLTFTDNHAVNGAAIFTQRGSPTLSCDAAAASFAALTASGNVAGSGGAIFVDVGMNASCSGCAITGNSAGIAGGGLALRPRSRVSLHDTTLSKNTAPAAGGSAIDCDRATLALFATTIDASNSVRCGAGCKYSSTASPSGDAQCRGGSDEDDGPNGLSHEVLAGISIAAIFGAIGILFCICGFVRRTQQRAKEAGKQHAQQGAYVALETQ